MENTYERVTAALDYMVKHWGMETPETRTGYRMAIYNATAQELWDYIDGVEMDLWEEEFVDFQIDFPDDYELEW